MNYCGFKNDRFCGLVECLFAGSYLCSICDVPNGDDFLKYYVKPVTIIETKLQHYLRLSDLPF